MSATSLNSAECAHRYSGIRYEPCPGCEIDSLRAELKTEKESWAHYADTVCLVLCTMNDYHFDRDGERRRYLRIDEACAAVRNLPFARPDGETLQPCRTCKGLHNAGQTCPLRPDGERKP